MTKVLIRTGETSGFFDRANDAAKRADNGGRFDGRVTLAIEDPQNMFSVLSQTRRRLMPGAHLFRGYQDNTEFALHLHALIGGKE